MIRDLIRLCKFFSYVYLFGCCQWDDEDDDDKKKEKDNTNKTKQPLLNGEINLNCF